MPPPPSSTVLYARTFLGTHCATHWAVCAGPALALPRHAARAPRALSLPRRGWPRASAAHVASERRPRHVEQTRACAAPSRRVCSQSPFGFPYSAETGPPWGCCASPFQTRQSGCIPIPPAPRGLSCVLPRAPASSDSQSARSPSRSPRRESAVGCEGAASDTPHFLVHPSILQSFGSSVLSPSCDGRN